MASFAALRNDLVVRAARGEPVERTPVWCHRQAGRYLPEFRDLRAKHAFFEICRTPSLACEATLQPLRRIAFDAAIIFSDILVIPQALGLQVDMRPDVGPVFPDPIVAPDDLDRLPRDVDIDAELAYVYEAITLTRTKLDGRVPLFGFCGAPWTLMAYCIEGRGSKTLSKAKRWLFRYPDASRRFLQRITDACVTFLVGQVRAGAQMLEVFDTWAGQLAPREFAEFALPYLKQIAEGVKRQLEEGALGVVPMTVFAKDAHYALEDLSMSGFDVISLDWTADGAAAVRAVGGRVALQGNLDPCVLYGDDGAIRRRATEMVQSFAGAKGYIANLGHGCYPDFQPDSVRAFIDAVHDAPLP
ncbi:uroporphyrinogen decarboxylase [Plasmodiophora brassicae]